MSRNPDRDRAIFKAYCCGTHQDDLAAEYGLSYTRINQIIALQRGKLPSMTSAQLREELKVQLDDVRRQLHTILDHEPSAKYEYGEDGEVASIEWDQSARIQAARQIVAVQNRLAKMLGLDSPEQVHAETTVRYELVGVDPEEL